MDDRQALRAQRDLILAAAKRLLPKCRTLRVVQHEDGHSWFVEDPESKLWWEARPGEGRRFEAVVFFPIVWRPGATPRTPEQTLTDEDAGDFTEGW